MIEYNFEKQHLQEALNNCLGSKERYKILRQTRTSKYECRNTTAMLIYFLNIYFL